ncbi:ATP-binding protein [Imhoffiella purpurea]|uniref:YhaN AAA domain-containing protein n=1 Tax=Imhoffiella purpurea TaxID=1249627 RepID=W9VKK1_9GAMM|nr:YhaN family protein [Imhoffiella purpurea]EXJ16612.1 hypothetical protein D779_4165 [Imhoffiella purpurea]
MKILDLYLQAYGPFSGAHLDLSGGTQGLHLVFGPNEAGKSSAMRALRALLYGVPEHTPDDFRHGRQDLRVGARLRASGGDELVCYRRKGRKNTLLGPDGKAIPDASLAPLLGGIDERLFERLFGIDHDSLVSGGDALLAERGREAEALFASGLGSTDVQSVLRQLDQEAEALFRPRARNSSINGRLSKLAEIEKAQREATLSAGQWEQARKSFETARSSLEQTDQALRQASRERSRLERIRRTLPNLARRDRLADQLAALGELPSLADDFAKKREGASAELRLAQAARTAAETRAAELRATLQTLPVRFALLDEADLIEALRERLGSHRKASADRPGLVAQRQALIAQAESLLARDRSGESLDQARALRPVLGRQRRVTELAGERAACTSRHQEAARQLARLDRELPDRRGLLSELGQAEPLAELERALDAARRAGDLEGTMAELNRRLRTQTADLERDLAGLGLWSGELDVFRRLPLPAEETVARFARDLQSLADEERRGEQERDEALAEQARAGESLRALELAGSVPSESELDQARDHRDRGWRIIRRQWLEGVDVADEVHAYAGTQTLQDAFEGALGSADEVSDRLRRESQRVHARAADQSRLESSARRLEAADTVLVSAVERRRHLLADWSALWSLCGLEPLPPHEMASWLGKALRLRERIDALGALRQERAGLFEGAVSLQESLRSALCEFGDAPAADATGLARMVSLAEARLADLADRAQQRQRLVEEIAELERHRADQATELQDLEAEVARLTADWTQLMAELGLPAETGPGEAADGLKSLAQVLELIDQADQLGGRISGIDADAEAFAAETRALVDRLAPEQSGIPFDQGLIQLGASLTRQRDDHARREEIRSQLEGAEHEARTQATRLKAAESVLADLCRQAGCAAPEALPALEERVRERGLRLRELDAVEAELLEAGDGLDIEALRAEAASIDRDEVTAALAGLESRIESELRPRHTESVERKLVAERELAAMAGEDRAAVLADEAQGLRSEIRSAAERYVRVRLAARILRDEIERFRREHRDPILARASHYFARLTCGGFAAVETHFDASDEPVLVGLRAEGERVGVGGMSTGTRDQLYLALRLASLEHHLEQVEPLPFIVDDILIQFDDARARATLAALAEFSAKTQVILFTHHQRVLEQAAELDPRQDRILVHSL